MKKDMEDIIMPFFNIDNIDELINYMMKDGRWGPQGTIMLIVLMQQNGYKQKAQTLFDEEFQLTNEQYKEFLKTLGDRIGLAY